MQAASVPALAISIAALVISVYGVLERRSAARRAERLRLATIIDELSGLQLEHARANLDTPDEDLVAGLNARRELLCAQALPLVRRFDRTITSPEFRTVAHALSRAGYVPEADDIWQRAIAAADGTTQSLFAHRGYAYHLFDADRMDDGRAQMRQAIAAAAGTAPLERIRTLAFWAVAERRADPASAEATALRNEAAALTAKLPAAFTRQSLLDLLDATG